MTSRVENYSEQVIKIDLTTSDALNDAILTALFSGYGYRLESDLWGRPQVVRDTTSQPSNPANRDEVRS